MTQDFLHDVRVLDLSQFIPGPYTTRLMADLGATVIKIEPPGGDPLRRISGADVISPEYLLMNAGKAVVEIDLKSNDGRLHLDRLIAGADVLVESFRPGVIDRLGFSRRRLLELNSGLIHCALSGLGQTGPYRLRPGHDVNYMVLGGGLAASGAPARPVLAFPPTADYASGLQAAFTIVASLLSRRGGRATGAWIDTSIMETVLSWQAIGLTQARASHLRRGESQLNGGAASYNLYQTSDDRWLSIGIVGEERFWRALCQVLGREDLVERLYDPLPQQDLIAELRQIFVGRTLMEWSELLADIETCAEPVAEFDDVLAHPQVVARGLVGPMAGCDAIEVRYPAWIDGEPPAGRRIPIFVADPSAVSWGTVFRRAKGAHLTR